jgi:hypothetical protein
MENVFTGSYSFLKFSKFAGFYPLAIAGPSKAGNLKLTWRGVFISFLWFLLFIWLTSRAMTAESFVIGESVILTKAWNITTKSEFLLYFLLFGYQIYKYKNVENFLKTLQSFDDEVNKV